MKRLLKWLLILGMVTVGAVFSCQKVLAISASGPWSAGEGGGGTVSIDFPAAGGSVNGSFGGGGSYGVRYGGSFSGNFTGGWDGTFSGRFSGWFKYPDIQGEIRTANVGGPWSGSLNPGGTVTAKFTNTVPGGTDGRATVNFSPQEFADEYGMSYEEWLKPKPSPKSAEDRWIDAVPDEEVEEKIKIVGEGEAEEKYGLGEVWNKLFKRKWETDVKTNKGVYVTINGEKQLLTSGTVLEKGAVVEVEEEGGGAVFATATGEYISLRGKGTRIEIMGPESVDKRGWKQIIREHGYREDIYIQSSAKVEKEVIAVHQGSMMIKYQTGDKTGYWGQNVSQYADKLGTKERGGPLVSFSRAVRIEEDKTIETPMFEGRTEMVTAMVENHSSVEYVYGEDGRVIEMRVYEGEVVLYRLDLETGESEEVMRATTGESLKLAIEEWEAGIKDEGVTKGTFDVKDKSEVAKNLDKYILIDKVKTGGLIVLGIGLVAVVGLKIIKNKKGKK